MNEEKGVLDKNWELSKNWCVLYACKTWEQAHEEGTQGKQEAE